jgi:hypothetical protein
MLNKKAKTAKAIVSALADIYLTLVAGYIGGPPSFVKPDISDFNKKMRAYYNKNIHLKPPSWDNTGRKISNLLTPLFATGSLMDYILDQGMNRSYKTHNSRDQFFAKVGILEDFPSASNINKMWGLVAIHEGLPLHIRGAAKSTRLPARPFISYPATDLQQELIYAFQIQFIDNLVASISQRYKYLVSINRPNPPP